MFSVAPVAPRLWWHDIYETQISGETVLHKVYEVYVVYKQGPTGIEHEIKFVEKE